ncbi:hypothetical protein K4K57_002240 [Colletotrichum sp. SAR 10_99]|nr:hypothetical protein K4K57_002240 [Colletotrichum sp. SAR 10_99]
MASRSPSHLDLTRPAYNGTSSPTRVAAIARLGKLVDMAALQADVVEPDDFNDNDSAVGDTNVRISRHARSVKALTSGLGRDLDDGELEQLYPGLSQGERPHLSQIPRWKSLVSISLRHSRSSFRQTSSGYLELQEFGLPLSDDGTLTPDHALHKSMALLGEAAAKMDHAFIELSTLRPMVEAAGFVDVAEICFKWPSNTWPRHAKFKELGAWNYDNITTGLQGFLMAFLTRGLAWKADEVNVLAAQTRKDVGDRSIHAYWPMIVVYGRKPA